MDSILIARGCAFKVTSPCAYTDAKRLRELESENAKLKRLLAEAHLDIHALKDVFGVKP